MFNSLELIRNLEAGGDLRIIHLPVLDGQALHFLDSILVRICEGNSRTSLNITKIKVLNFLNRYHQGNTRYGAVAEFFIHAYLLHAGFKQECKFLNLEESGAIKKGFDGLYSKGNEIWLMESKCLLPSTENGSHLDKLSEAYRDLRDKVSGNVLNNPWENAYNHASHRDVGTNDAIIDKIKILSDEFVLRKFHDVADFNCIPSSTIFHHPGTFCHDADAIIESVSSSHLSRLPKWIGICIDSESYQQFIDYLSA